MEMVREEEQKTRGKRRGRRGMCFLYENITYHALKKTRVSIIILKEDIFI